jgi:hypothetical protein
MLLSMSNHYQTRAPRRQNGAGWTLTLKYGSTHEAAATLGGVPVIRETFVGFQRYLYET